MDAQCQNAPTNIMLPLLLLLGIFLLLLNSKSAPFPLDS
jgi:hypothetical protein